jgi:tetratricopeptide (TPR) repeat protein
MREYIIPEFRGQRLHQKNIFGYTVIGNRGFDFHISKASYSPTDDEFLGTLLKGISLISDYKPDSFTEFGYGSIYYLRQDWTRAAGHYEKSLQLEKEKRALGQTQWNVLVDNLGMAYGMSGHLSKAKAIFEYGIQENPTYPMFRYNLACADAELGDVDSAMAELSLAFKYKSYSNPGEGIPDPARDDSFKRYLSDPKFSKMVNRLCPSSKQTEGGWECQ